MKRFTGAHVTIASHSSRRNSFRSISLNLSRAVLLAIALGSPTVGQSTRVSIEKHLTGIPKECESVLPAEVDRTIDIAALIKEAICKGAGDMLIDYTFVVEALKRQKNEKGQVKEERVISEVFIPTLKSGVRTRGVMVVTSRNNVPVAPHELEKERLRAAERIEKEEKKIARQASAPLEVDRSPVAGMKPIGMYAQTGVNRESFGVSRGGAILAVPSFLRACELTFARREKINERDTLIFSFTPRPEVTYDEKEEYIAQLRGEIWIDVRDRIVTRLVGWPANSAAELPPAVYFAMMHLPKDGIWLPQTTRINAADYKNLFDGLTTDSSWIISNYVRFSTEIKDVTVGTTNKQ